MGLPSTTAMVLLSMPQVERVVADATLAAEAASWPA